MPATKYGTARSGRFQRRRRAGQALTVEIWDGAAGAEVLFRTRTEDGTVVIDRGLSTVTPA